MEMGVALYNPCYSSFLYNPVFFVLSSQTSFGDIIFCSAEFLQILTVLIKLTDHPKSMPDKTCFRDMIHLSALVKTALGPAKNVGKIHVTLNIPALKTYRSLRQSSRIAMQELHTISVSYCYKVLTQIRWHVNSIYQSDFSCACANR